MSSLSGPSGASGAALQSDTSLWLHNKLGTSNDSWTGGSIVSQLNPEILSKIHGCFQDLQPQVKLKLLLSFFHIPRRNLEIWRSKLEAILDVASEDSEPWVCMLAELMKTYPSSGQLNSDIQVPDTNRKIFNDLVSDLKKALKKSNQSESVLPLECHYLNKNAFITAVGHMPQTSKHFTLKRKPKAAALKADLINKSQDAANKVKSSSGGAFPMRKSTMPRKMTSDLKGTPGRSFGQFRNHSRPSLPNRPAVRKPGESGGVKLLDITEQPMGYAQAKKRKKQMEEEEKERAEKEKREKKEQEKREKAESKVKDAGMPGAGAKGATPDYAAGLASLNNPPTPASGNLPPPSYAPPTPTPIQPPEMALPPPQLSQAQSSQHNQPSRAPPVLVSSMSSVASSSAPVAPPSYAPPRPSPAIALGPPSASNISLNRPPPPGVALPTAPVPPTPPPNTAFPVGLSSLEPLPQAAVRGLPSPYPVNLPRNPQPAQSVAGTGGPRLVQLPTQPLPQSQARFSSPRVQTTILRTPTPGGPPASVLGAALQQASPRVIEPRNIRSVLSTLQPQPQQPQAAAAPAAQAVATQPQRKSLTLTREQALEAQDMFRTANKVTRPEKALILGFMAGSRDNPCPHLGNVVTIKLSENQENVLQADQTYLTMIVETHFQMNYSSGQWTRIKKYRRLEDA